ncbi:hypothetical protein BD410DRAFT_754512 [Rickenella mellea]|uniref:DUF6533 domain-containing protein n=1 Tax=Rickenella mellea TaxID=50990 RepID=A0A4Y7PQ84_9AGAM|nr:hypothetical protein BD410DRAFT_754512 [Rickenella mellea]
MKQEISFFWKRRITFAASLFFACRYLTLIGNVPVIFQVFSYWSPEGRLVFSCRLLQRYHQLMSMTIQTLVGIILITRTYALYERSRRVLALMCLTACYVIVFGCWSVMRTASTGDNPPALPDMTRCDGRIEDAVGRRYGAAWVGVVVFDTEILLLTMWKSVKLSRIGGGRLVRVLLRDGCIYYVILTVANMSQILTFLYAPPLLKGLSTTFVNVISVIVISRAMMNLQNPKCLKNTGYLDTLPGLGTFDESEIYLSEID